jgi:two-component SAPR family response regulator
MLFSPRERRVAVKRSLRPRRYPNRYPFGIETVHLGFRNCLTVANLGDNAPMRAVEPEKGILSVRLFGPFEVHVEGVPLPPVRSRKILWAFGLLVLRNGRPVDREWLARTLWPENDLSQALANLRPNVSQLRAALGKEAVRIEAPDRRMLRLNLQGAFADVVLFDKLVASSRSTDLEMAVDLYRGPLLEG